MDRDALPVLSLSGDSDSFSAAIGESFRTYGFALVSDHGLAPELVERGWQLTARFFALDDAEKRACSIAHRDQHPPGRGP